MRESSLAVVPVTQVTVLVAPANAVPVLRDVLRTLQGEYPGAIVILLHPGSEQNRPVADNLNVSPSLLIMPATDGERLRNHRGYVVRSGDPLVLGADGCFTRTFGVDADDDATLLGEDRDVDASRWRSEEILASLASRYGSGAIAVALTALDVHESEGFHQIRSAGGHTIALDESDRLWADSSGPRVVPSADDELLPAAEIGPRMIQLAALARGDQ